MVVLLCRPQERLFPSISVDLYKPSSQSQQVCHPQNT